MGDCGAGGVKVDPSVKLDGNILASTPDSAMGLPVATLVAIFATHEPAELDRAMDRMFGGKGLYDDQLLSSLITISNSFAHALERLRQRRGLRPIKLRCMTCKA